MKITSTFGLGTALAIAALVGCGGNSSGGGFTTSVPSGTKLTSLTPQQAMQLCTDFDAYATNALTPDLCKLLAIEATALSLSFSSTGQPSDAMLQMTCTQTYNNCLSGGDGGITSTSNCDPSDLHDPSRPPVRRRSVTSRCAPTPTSPPPNRKWRASPAAARSRRRTCSPRWRRSRPNADAGTSMSATCTALESNCNGGSSSSSTVGLVTAMKRLRK